MNKSVGHMYEWITAKRNYLGGECPHKCAYCYVDNFKKKYPNVKERYTGEIRLIEKELEKNEGSGRVIFVQDCSDLFADEVPSEFIKRILDHCRKFDNTYLFQTKNPIRFSKFDFPIKTILGITLESNRGYKGITKAPKPRERINDFYKVEGHDKMISVEPILEFDLEVMVEWIRQINPLFVSIGADSKGHQLLEPSKKKVDKLIGELKKFTDVKIKKNLRRLR